MNYSKRRFYCLCVITYWNGSVNGQTRDCSRRNFCCPYGPEQCGALHRSYSFKQIPNHRHCRTAVLFFPDKVIINSFPAIDKDTLPCAESIGDGQEIRPLCDFFGGGPSSERGFIHNLRP